MNIKIFVRANELAVSAFAATIVWIIGVGGLQLVYLEGHGIANINISRGHLLLAAPIFLGVTSYFLVRWSHGYRGPSDLIVLLKQRSSTFPGWIKATATWVIACIELGSGLSPKGFEGPYVAAAGGLGGLLATKLSLDADARRRVARCALGVAFGLLFRAPLAGFVCMFEFGGFDREMFQKQLVPAVVATVINIVLTNTLRLPMPFPPLALDFPLSLRVLALLCMLGVCAGVISVLYVWCIRWSKVIFQRAATRLPFLLIPLLGALVTTLLGAAFPLILGANDVYRVLSAAPALSATLLAIILAKIIATAAADGSKLAGGTVGPAILLGALVGGAFVHASPLLVVAGAVAVTGPIAGIPLTMLMTGITWLGFAPMSLLIGFPLLISKVVSRGTELYPYIPPSTTVTRV